MAFTLFVLVLFASQQWVAYPTIAIESSPDSLEEENEKRTPPANFSSANQKLLENCQKNMKRVLELLMNMREDPSTQQFIPGSSKQFKIKIASVRSKWTKACKDAYDAGEEGMAKMIFEAISEAAKGLVDVVNGIKDDDWKTGVQGALKTVSSVSQLDGLDVNKPASVMAFISKIFDLFGVSAEIESVDDKTEGSKEYFDSVKEQNLKEEIEDMGYEMSSIRSSVKIRQDSIKPKKQGTQVVLEQMFSYYKLMDEYKVRIKESCDNVKRYGKAMKCLDIINSYSSEGFERRVFMTELASSIVDLRDQECKECDKYKKDPKLKARQRDQRSIENPSKNYEDCGKIFLASAEGPLKAMREEQDNEKNLLLFIIDPFNFPKRRYVVSMFFYSNHKHSDLRSYIHTLHNLVPGGMFKDYVMLCSEAHLGGDCKTLTLGSYADLTNDPKIGLSRVKSVYVPLHLKITAFIGTGFQGRRWGPFAGPISLTELEEGQRANWKSVKVEKSTRNADKEVRICQTEMLSPGFCDSLSTGNYNLEDLHGSAWKGKIRTFYVPRGKTLRGVNAWGRMFNLVGEQTSYHRLLNYEDIIVKGTTNGDFKDNRDVSKQVEFCDAEDLRGNCKKSWLNVGNFGFFFGGSCKQVKSVNIPSSIQVIGFSEINFVGALEGPYVGPLIISKLDHLFTWQSMMISEYGTSN